MTAEEFLEGLEKVRKVGSGWVARCPAHDDKTPSLSVKRREDGRILVCCHVGCTTEAICEARGITISNLFPESQQKRRKGYATPENAAKAITARIRGHLSSAWKLAKTYSYLVNGHEAFRILRLEGPNGEKTFRPIHSSEGRWFEGDPKGSLPLFRLPDLEKGEGVVFVCEGEKAAEAAVAIGLIATTSAHGAKAAAKTDWSSLAGKDVVIMPDNDDPGRAYAVQVAEILLSLGTRARVLELPDLPEGGDVVEFIAGRRSSEFDDAAIREEILRLAEGIPPYVGSGGSAGGGQEDSEGGYVSSGSGGLGPPPVFGDLVPLPNDLPPVAEFDMRLLPESIRPWIRDVAERIQCPPDFPAVAAMVALSSVLGRKVGIRPKRRDDWVVVANLWGAIIGRPGIMKTPPLQEATRPLKRLEIEAKKRFEEEMKDYEAEELVFKARKKAEGSKIEKAIKHDQGEEALGIARDTIDFRPEQPTRQRYVVNDSTVEKLGEILNENPNGVLTLRDELTGLLRNLDKEGQECARAFYLEAWNGTDRFTYDRIGRGTIDIEAAILSVLGSIQPGPLAFYLRQAVEGGHGDDGLMSRFQLAVWPDVTKEWRNVDEWPDTEAKNRAHEVFNCLDGLDPMSVAAVADDGDEDSIPYLRFSPRAQVVFDRWRGGLERRLRSGEEHPAIESHFAKYRSLIPALALLIHLADHGTGPVELKPLRMAIAWGRYLASHARRIYSVAVRAEIAAARMLAARIEKGGLADGFTHREVYRRGWTGLDRRATEEAVHVLVDHGWLVVQKLATGGAPKLVCRINPLILQGRREVSESVGRGAPDSPGNPSDGTDTTARRVRAGSSGTTEPEVGGEEDQETPRGGPDRTDKSTPGATSVSSGTRESGAPAESGGKEWGDV